MANVFSPTLQAALFRTARVVPNELTAFLKASRRDFDITGVQQGGKAKVTVVPRVTSGSTPAPAMSFVAGADRTPTTIDLNLNQTAEASWNLTAEDERLLEASGTALDVLAQTVAQGWRSMRNQIETYAGIVAKNNASRAVGTAGTTPFASNSDLLIDARKILADNGSTSRRTAILNTAAEANLMKLSQLQKVSEAGESANLRDGQIGRLFSMDLLESAGVATHTKGTMTGALINSAAMVAGTTAIIFDTGTGGATGFVAGDVIAIAGDANKYVVAVGLNAAAGTITIQEPGLLGAVADNAAITVENTSTDNIVMGENGMVIAARPALQPVGGIAEQMVLADPETKISCLLLRVPGSGMTSWYMRMVYDAFAPNPYEIVKLRG